MFDRKALSSDLEVPYALTDLETICSPNMAKKGLRYTCPECSQLLILKHGEIRRPHFAHAPDTYSCPFYGESKQHILAKHLIVLAVQKWLDGTHPAPKVHTRCSAEVHDQVFPLHDCIKHVIAEKRIRHAGQERSYIPDVVLSNSNNKPVLCIEVFHRNAVDAEKEAMFQFATLEVQAQKIIDDPLNWHCRRGWKLPIKECVLCKEDEAREQVLQKWRRDHTKPADVKPEAMGTGPVSPAARSPGTPTMRESRIEELRTVGDWREVRTTKHGKRTVSPCPLGAQQYNGRFFAFVDFDCETCNYLIDKDGPVSGDILNGMWVTLQRIKCAGADHREGDDELGLGPAKAPRRKR